MIIVMEPDADEAAIAAVEAKIRAHGLDVHVSRGTERTLIGAIGDERKLDPEMFDTMPGVEKSMHIVKPYKLVAREWHKANTVIDAGGVADRRQDGAGDRRSVLGRDRRRRCTPPPTACAAGGARLMRGGAFKPRTSPYAFQGKGVDGLKLLKDAAATPRAAGRHRADGRADARRVPRARRRRDPDRHAQHAELRPAEGRRRSDDAGDPEARHERDDQRMADGGRIHRRRRQPQHHLLRARHPHVRDRVPQRARRHRDSGDEARDAPAGDRRSVARGRQGVDGAGAVAARRSPPAPTAC